MIKSFSFHLIILKLFSYTAHTFIKGKLYVSCLSYLEWSAHSNAVFDMAWIKDEAKMVSYIL